MTGAVVAALALASAVLVQPVPIRRRLLPQSGPSDGARSNHRMVAICLLGVVAGVGVALCGAAVWVAVTVLTATLLWRRRQRLAGESDSRAARSMESALEVLIAELRIGAHPIRAFETAAAESDGTVGKSFRAVAARARLGADVPTGLRTVGAESPGGSADWERLAVFWQLASEHGLAIAALMRTAQLDLGERQRFNARVAAGMAGARATALILAGLPALGIVLGHLIGAAPVRFLTGPGVGGWFLVLGVFLICAGLLWSDRITGQVVR